MGLIVLISFPFFSKRTWLWKGKQRICRTILPKFHLKFVVEVRNGSQASNYHGGIVISGEFNQQVIEAFNANSLSEVFSEIGYFLLDVRDSFVDAEQRTFAGIDRDADHQAIEHLGGSVNDIGMAVGDGIESSRVDPDQRVCHRSYLPSTLRVVDPF